MLTLVEKILFVALALASAGAGLRAADRIRRIIRRGRGDFSLQHLPRRAWAALAKTLTLAPTWQVRWWPTLFHALVAWGFIYYLLVNLGDLLQAFLPGFVFLGQGPLGGLYRLGADLLSVGVLAGMALLLARRFALRSRSFRFRQSTLLHPRALFGIRRDSAIVGAFILFHIGSRFLGESFHLAERGPDAWQPAASAVAGLWAGWGAGSLSLAQHAAFWGALGSILLFVPYFLYSKHIHLFMAPLNFLLKPERKSIGALAAVNFDDESITQYGAARLEHLEWPALLDAYACIMCNRCQDACPAHATGKALSPAALEINKRYFLNQEGAALAAGQESSQSLLDFALSPEAVWACTACGACVDVCPVGNEPMRDILDMRRNLVLMETSFPDQLQQAFKGMERQGNPWMLGPETRLEWAAGLDVPTVEQNPDFELLYWVGCAPATDPRARLTARAFVKLLQAAGVNFAVLGRLERCTGDSARRSGNEFLFFQLAQQNVETINAVMGSGSGRRRIVTTCPHCLHSLQNEYPDFGGHYTVIHHTQLIQELIDLGRLPLKREVASVAFHDPCYLGRHNGVFDAPRAALGSTGARVVELPRHRRQSFCCGAGGAQMWKEEEHGAERINQNRFAEAARTGEGTLAVACPFCLIMLSDAATAVKSPMRVRDVAEIVAEQIA